MILVLVLLLFGFFSSRNIDITKNDILSMFSTYIFFTGYLPIILSLKNILNSILQQDPFTHQNVTYFKRIGYIILVIGLIEAIINYPKPNSTRLYLLSTSYGSLKPIFFLYMILSCLAFILGDVFQMAIEIKDDNNLTI